MQEEAINIVLNIIQNSGIILYPTDTVWGLGCDATDYDAVEKLYHLKQRDDSKAMICLVSDIEMLETYVKDIPQQVYEVLKKVEHPTTIIYSNPKEVSKNLIASDNSLAIRIVSKGFAHELIKKLGKPIVSTSANISGNPTPKSFEEIDDEILKGVDYIVNLPHESHNIKPSTILKVSKEGSVIVIRK